MSLALNARRVKVALRDVTDLSRLCKRQLAAGASHSSSSILSHRSGYVLAGG